MGTQVVKIEGGVESVLHRNLPDDAALDVAREVLAGNEPGSVQVRLTPLRWDDDNAEYRLAPDEAKELPVESDPADEQADEPKKPAAKKPAAKK